MTRFFVGLALALWFVCTPVTARAHDAYDDSQSHPLRLAAYAAYPIGFVVEWMVMRPLHFMVSNPQGERMFGHTPHESPFGGYEPYEPDSQ